MKKHVITRLLLPVVVVTAIGIASCQQRPATTDAQNASTAPKDTVASQGIKPDMLLSFIGPFFKGEIPKGMLEKTEY